MNKIFYTIDDLKNIKHDVKKVFFYRICGTGMGAAATLLKESGYIVEGGDVDFYPPMSTYLDESGIPLLKLSDCDDAYMKSFDLIIVGNVVPRESSDAKMLEGLGVKLTSFPQALGGLLLNRKKVVGISGTHGKTTTTYLGVQVFNNLGLDVGYLVGGVLPIGPSAKIGDDELFLIEADEYDTSYFEKTSKFLHYEIDHLILTSLEYDHADIFKDEKQMLESFHCLLKRKYISKIINDDYKMTKELSDQYPFELHYGESNETVGPILVSAKKGETVFKLMVKGESAKFTTNLDAGHNILNLSSIILLASSIGYKTSEIRKAILNLNLVKRRQEIRGHIGPSLIYDDFAHHPTAVQTTLTSIKKANPDKDIVAIFEPASSTARSDLFQERFASSFSGASDIVIIPPQRKSTVIVGGDLNLDKLSFDLCEKGKSVSIVDELDELKEVLLRLSNDKKIMVTLSNGKVLGLFCSDIIK